MVDIATISAVVAAIGVLIGVAFAIIEIRSLAKTRHMDMLMRIHLAWGSEDFKRAFGRTMGVLYQGFKDYDDFVSKYGPINAPDRPQIWDDIDRVGWFLNGIGFLVYRNYADVRQVEELFGHGTLILWDLMKPLVEGWRKQLNMPKSYQWFEYLYHEMKKRE